MSVLHTIYPLEEEHPFSQKISQIEGISFEYVSRQEEFSMQKPHFHLEDELYCLLSGERYYFIGNSSYYVGPGSLVFIGSNQIHKTTTVSHPSHERILLSFDPVILHQLETMWKHAEFTEMFHRQMPVLTPEKEQWNKIFPILMELQHSFENQRSTDWIHLKCSELLFLAQECFCYQQSFPVPVSSPKHQKVAEIAEYLSLHCREVNTLDEICSRFYISKFHLCRIFKEVTGFTVNGYLNQNKVEYAKHLLVHTDKSVTEIAADSGFESITHFEKTFKNFTGITPLRCRKEGIRQNTSKTK